VGKGDCELVGILAAGGLLARSPDPLPVWLRRQGADHWAHILLVQGPLRIHISYLKEQEHARRSTTDCKVKPGGTIPLPAADGIRTRVQGELVAPARFHALYIARIKVGVEDQAAALVRAHAAHPRSLARRGRLVLRENHKSRSFTFIHKRTMIHSTPSENRLAPPVSGHTGRLR
jgi:hypothetical protein